MLIYLSDLYVTQRSTGWFRPAVFTATLFLTGTVTLMTWKV